MTTEFATETTNIRSWYQDHYPDDRAADGINENVTFQDVFDALDRRRSVYKVLGVRDSIVRERVFAALVEIMDVEYDYVYDQWMICAE